MKLIPLTKNCYSCNCGDYIARMVIVYTDKPKDNDYMIVCNNCGRPPRHDQVEGPNQPKGLIQDGKFVDDPGGYWVPTETAEAIEREALLLKLWEEYCDKLELIDGSCPPLAQDEQAFKQTIRRLLEGIDTVKDQEKADGS